MLFNSGITKQEDGVKQQINVSHRTGSMSQEKVEGRAGADTAVLYLVNVLLTA